MAYRLILKQNSRLHVTKNCISNLNFHSSNLSSCFLVSDVPNFREVVIGVDNSCAKKELTELYEVFSYYQILD